MILFLEGGDVLMADRVVALVRDPEIGGSVVYLVDGRKYRTYYRPFGLVERFRSFLEGSAVLLRRASKG